MARRGHTTGGSPDVRVSDPNAVGARRRQARPGRPESKTSIPIHPGGLSQLPKNRFSCQGLLQAAMDTLQVVLPDLVMGTVNHTSLPDPPKPLTDFFVHMVPVPEMLVALAAFCQFTEHIFGNGCMKQKVFAQSPTTGVVKIVHRMVHFFQLVLAHFSRKRYNTTYWGTSSAGRAQGSQS